MTKFPHLLAAVEAREKHLADAEGRDLWAIGTAVLKDCYPDDGDRSPSRNNGTLKLIEAASRELAKLGYQEYSERYLRETAATVRNFPPSRRHAGLSFTAHLKAANPDLLDWVVKQAGGVEKLVTRDVQSWIDRWHTLQDIKRREKIEAVKEKRRHAETLDEKRKATEELKKLGNPMPTPKEDFVLPSKRDQSRLAAMADLLEIDVQAASMTKALRKNFVVLRDMEADIEQAFADALVAHHHELAEVATQIADLLGKSKKGRFTIVKGGAA